MRVDHNDLIGKTVDHIENGAVVFTDGAVLQWDHDGCEAIFTAEEWAAKS